MGFNPNAGKGMSGRPAPVRGNAPKRVAMGSGSATAANLVKARSYHPGASVTHDGGRAAAANNGADVDQTPSGKSVTIPRGVIDRTTNRRVCSSRVK